MVISIVYGAVVFVEDLQQVDFWELSSKLGTRNQAAETLVGLLD